MHIVYGRASFELNVNLLNSRFLICICVDRPPVSKVLRL